MPGSAGSHLRAPDGDHDIVEALEVVGPREGAEAQLDVARAIERGGMEAQQRSPAGPVGRGRGDRELAADRGAPVEHDDLARARQRGRALQAGRAGADDRHATATGGAACGGAHDERRRGPRAVAPGAEVRVDRAQEHGVERAAVLVAGDARADLRLAPREQLARHVGVGDQRPRHADEVGAGGERRVDRVAACGTPARRAAGRPRAGGCVRGARSSGGSAVAMSRT